MKIFLYKLVPIQGKKEVEPILGVKNSSKVLKAQIKYKACVQSCWNQIKIIKDFSEAQPASLLRYTVQRQWELLTCLELSSVLCPQVT